MGRATKSLITTTATLVVVGLALMINQALAGDATSTASKDLCVTVERGEVVTGSCEDSGWTADSVLDSELFAKVQLKFQEPIF